MTISKKVASFSVGVITLMCSLAGVASAHVVVKPGEVLTSAFTTFSVGVPVEKDVATTAVKLEVPAGLGHVTPTVKPGWAITVEKEGEVATSITWSGGQIAGGFRDEFTFSAKTPSEPTELQWKAFQTYADGTVVAWNVNEADQPKKADGSPDFSASGPFSVTKVVSESAQDAALTHAHNNAHDAQNAAKWALYIGAAGVILGLAAVLIATRKKA